ncbi:MAG: hypothetical protein ACK5Z5_10210 [Neisseriaceae bacterium]
MKFKNYIAYTDSELDRILDIHKNKSTSIEFEFGEESILKEYRNILIDAMHQAEYQFPNHSALFNLIRFLLDIQFEQYIVEEELTYIESILIKTKIIAKYNKQSKNFLIPGDCYKEFIKGIFQLGYLRIFPNGQNQFKDIEQVLETGVELVYSYINNNFKGNDCNAPKNLFKYLLLNQEPDCKEYELNKIHLEVDVIKPQKYIISKSTINFSDHFSKYKLKNITFLNCEFVGGGNINFVKCKLQDCKFNNCNIVVNNCTINGNFEVDIEEKLTLNFNSTNILDANNKFTLYLNNINSADIFIENSHSISLHIDSSCKIDNIITKDSTYINFHILGNISKLPTLVDTKIYSFIKVKYNNFGYAECNVFSDALSEMGCKETAIEYKAYALKAYQLQSSTVEKIFLWIYSILNQKGKNIWLPLLWIILLLGIWTIYYFCKFYEPKHIFDSLNNALYVSLKEVLWPLKILGVDREISIFKKFPVNIFIDLFSKVFSTICLYLFIKGIKLRYEVKV